MCLKADGQYKRRITRIDRLPVHLGTSVPALMLVEYIGTFPGHIRHGNSKINTQHYIRTSAKVREQIKEELE